MKSLKIKLALLVCLIAFLISLALTGVNAFMLNKTAVQGMNTSVTETAKAYASDIGNQIAKYKSDISIIATNTAIAPTATQSELKSLSDSLKKAYGYSDISFAVANGTPYDNAALDLSDRDYFKGAMTGQPFISSPLVNKKDNTTVLYFAAKVDNGTGYNGITFAALENDVFSQIIKNVSIGKKGYGFIVDSAGTIVAHKDNKFVEDFTNYITLSEEKTEYKELGTFVGNMLANKSGTGEVKIDNSTKYVAYSPIANTNGWILAIIADKDEMLATYKQGLFISLAIAVGFLILAFVFAFLFGNTISNKISDITTVAEKVSSGSIMISNSSMALARGATEQASAVEELTTSLEEISSQTTLNADNAEKANTLVRNARDNAETGNALMNEMLKAMDAINASSGNISKIIKVINDIAFQTNILALNAAVEAARAGQHGMGFAVVAEEVRTLASRSASAAKETSVMIAESIENVNLGIQIADETAKALKEIVAKIASATDLVGSIAGASQDQAISIEQVNQGTIQVSQVVQSNAATSEETAAASSELLSQATQLKEVISIFK